jgi:hypothetical protein
MYTLIVFKKDGRTKKGEREFIRTDYNTTNLAELTANVRDAWPAPQYRTEIHETYVTRVNMMSGQSFQERFDTPHYCSPSSETYWSM